jgi:hypothetical protein
LVRQVQPDGRLDEYVDAPLGAHLRGQLEPLALATRQPCTNAL